jgi:hypothetical protein
MGLEQAFLAEWVVYYEAGKAGKEFVVCVAEGLAFEGEKGGKGA